MITIDFIKEQMLGAGIMGGAIALIAVIITFGLVKLFKVKEGVKNKKVPVIIGVVMLLLYISVKILPIIIRKVEYSSGREQNICVTSKDNQKHCLDQNRIPLECIFNDYKDDWCRELKKLKEDFDTKRSTP